eukprot:NODE_9898_length_1391_cov_11.928006.p1 GENE.NODE_9898_length_1391_cov_11.928006~~NODE_9898_length_1391_cov_11.928006.p1  ORF type:complete len:237 (-),score=71.68 NODE_9898_length_1391_cov_11.928006:680-1291(-)
MRLKDPPLRFTWTLWEQIAQTDMKAQYSDQTHPVVSFSTIKGFWRYWNHIPQPSELLEGKKFVRDGSEPRVVDALMVFRENIKPEWEDVANATGGHFLVQLLPRIGAGAIDEYWNNIVLGMIGGSIEPAEMITGVRLVDKLLAGRAPSVRIEVWFSHFDDTARVDQLQASLEVCMSRRLDGAPSASLPAYVKIDRKTHVLKKN